MPRVRRIRSSVLRDIRTQSGSSAGRVTIGSRSEEPTIIPPDRRTGFHTGNTPMVKVRNNANTTTTTSTNTLIAFQEKVIDTNAMWDSGTNTRLTCRTPGRYLVHANISWDANGNGGIRDIVFRLNGGTFFEADIVHVSSVNEPVMQNMMTVFDLSVNDYLEVYAFQNSGVNADVQTTSYFGMTRVGD